MTVKNNKGLALWLAMALVIASVSWGFAQTQANPPKAKININTATQAELEALPRIGPSVAKGIVDFRTRNGNFKKIEDLMKVRGVGEKIFQQIKDLITVGQESQAK